MPLETIAPQISWGNIRAALNRNFTESEDRFQAIEVTAYIRFGNGVPSNANHNENDYYIDESTWILYRKQNGNWETKTSLIGTGFKPQGAWVVGTMYDINDVVTHQGSTWRCLVNQIAASEPSTSNLEWERFVYGVRFVGNWSASATYQVDNLVFRDGSLWRANTNHAATASNWPGSLNAPWSEVATGYTYSGAWVSGVFYPKNRLVRADGAVFRVINAHTSSTAPSVALPGADYELFSQSGLSYKGEYSSTTLYENSDTVTYRGSLWRAVPNSNFSNIAPEESGGVWIRIVHGFNNAGAWSSTAYYYKDDFVTHNGSYYRRIVTGEPSATTPPNDAANWQLIASKGDTGSTGATGPGVPNGGATGQSLVKSSATNQDTSWATRTEFDSIDNGQSLYTSQGLTANTQLVTADLRTGSVPTDAKGVWINVITPAQASQANIFIAGADTTTPNLMRHAANTAGVESSVLPVKLGTGVNAGKIKFLSSVAVTGMIVVIVGWWR